MFFDVKRLYVSQIEQEICARQYELQFCNLDPNYRDLILKRLSDLFNELVLRDL